MGPNNPPEKITISVSCHVTFSCDGEIIHDNDTNQERNIEVPGNLTRDDQNYRIYRIFNGMRKNEEDSIVMNSPWFLMYVIATNSNGNEEPHILSCHCRKQSFCYYLIKSAGQKVLLFQFKSLAHIANHLFTKDGRIKLMNFLREYGPFADISASYVNDVVAHLVIIPKKI